MRIISVLSLVFTLTIGSISFVNAQKIHQSYSQLLSKYVNDQGRVDYNGFKKDERLLDDYLDKLSEQTGISQMSRDEQLVYWINLYNASTIKLILKHYPISSIMDIANGKPWDIKWIKVGNKTYSLNNIENDIIRPQFKEPRIHFAVNCAAQSCPPLLNRAWNVATLNDDFGNRAKNFINNEFYNTINKETINISKIFDWYKSDFGNILRFINKYSKVNIDSNSKIDYKPYNWKLNKV